MKKLGVIAIILIISVSSGHFVYTKFLHKEVLTNGPFVNGKLPELSPSEASEAIAIPFRTGSTDEDRLRFIAAVQKLATSTSEIVIKECVALPKVFETLPGSIIKIRNVGDSLISIRFSFEEPQNIAPGDFIELPIRSNRDVNSVSSYECDGAFAGVIYVPQERPL